MNMMPRKRPHGAAQNWLLLSGVSERLEAVGLAVLRPSRHPTNDSGLALGQAEVAAGHMLGDA